LKLTLQQLGIAIGLLSITFFFGALILGVDLRIAEQGSWKRFSVPNLLWLSTVLLIASSGMLEAGRYALRRALVAIYRFRLAATLSCAVAFLLIQVLSARDLLEQGVTASGNIHGSAFYIFMGIHGAHLGGGVTWIAWLFVRSRSLFHASENELRRHRTAIQTAALYWHYMGALWLVLFFFLLRWTYG
jgi:cytochrome c oxidase subunit III